MDIRILMVEDNEHICNTVKVYLNAAGYHADTCSDGDKALEMIYEHIYTLIILDIMLPGMNGHDLLREIRKLAHIPVLMLTALDDDENQVRAFSAQADDYITKPFNMQLLLLRVEALLRRSGALSKEVRCGHLTLYPEAQRAEYSGTQLSLTKKEYDILLLLASNKGKVLSSTTILSRIWSFDYSGDEATVWTHMKNLRNKLPGDIIRTIRGSGYMLEDES